MINVELLYDDEEFRRIYYNGIETNYMISNYGRVWSDNRNIIMKNGTDRNGRANIHLLVNGKNWIPNISRLLGLTFLGEPPEPDWEIDHIDNNPFNNSLSNLQWLSPFDNKSKAHRDGCIDYYEQPLGEDAFASIYTYEQVKYACELMEAGYDINFIYDETLISKTALRNIQSRRDWCSISCYYKVENMSISKPRRTPSYIKEEVLELLKKGLSNKDINSIIYEKYQFEATTLAANLRKRELK